MLNIAAGSLILTLLYTGHPFWKGWLSYIHIVDMLFYLFPVNGWLLFGQFADLVTPDLLRTRRHNKKVKKVSKAHASIEDGKSTSMVGKDDREQDALQGGTKSLESDDDDSGNDDDDSESDDDGESFFLQSQKNKSRGLLTKWVLISYSIDWFHHIDPFSVFTSKPSCSLYISHVLFLWSDN